MQGLIRNRCVNDGRPDSGGETKSARLLAEYLEGAGLHLEIVEPHPGRGSLIATLPGTEGPGGGLVLMGHTDVVEAQQDNWAVPPFDGALIDGVIWGRGAVDMLGMTATMAVSLRHLAASGFRPRHDVTVLAVADEEAGGRWGAGWLARNRPELFRERSVVTETGGFPLHTSRGVRLECAIGEKGTLGCTVIIEGTPSHGALPYRTDNPLLKLPEVLRRLSRYQPAPRLDDLWLDYLAGMALPDRWQPGLADPDTFDRTLKELPVGLARHFHAITRTTITPTIVRAGKKKNVIPGHAEVHLDIRVFPGETRDEVEGAIRSLLNGLDDVRLETFGWRAGSLSSRKTELWSAIEAVVDDLVPGAEMVADVSSATTDGRHVRPLGVPCYGFGLFSERIPAEEYFAMFHSVDERIDQESLLLLCRLWFCLAQHLPGPAAGGLTPSH
ncbi:M20/M25/M40 family metallo-hydrolase [Streptomyces sp. NPDC020681]|uniref:M20/M25/M40 family metallo-hydrolase n=1 Tax=Streptomyces sp. NPDC020681 TaxID=3365083 RepID=UPI003793342D